MKLAYGAALALSIAATPLACSSKAASAGSSESDGGDQSDAASVLDSATYDSGKCLVTIDERAFEGAAHVAMCSHIDYRSNPPSSGSHYDDYPGYGVYASALPRGFWVHALEHGTITLSYNCPESCDGELEAAKAFVNGLPVDAYCASRGFLRPRVILTPDPLLDTRWAASAWRVTLRADCFDAAAFGSFYDAHVGNGRENICGTGVELRRSDGTLALPDDCGAE